MAAWGNHGNKDCYLTVTAYDDEGHESWYSNMEWRRGGYWIYLSTCLSSLQRRPTRAPRAMLGQALARKMPGTDRALPGQ